MMRGKSPPSADFCSIYDILGPAEGCSGSEIGLGGAKTSLDNFLLR